MRVTAPRTVREELLAYFAQDHDLIQDPYPMYARAVAEAPVIWLDDQLGLVARHALAKTTARDAETFVPPPSRTRSFADSTSLLSEEEVVLLKEVHALESRTLTRLTGEDHRRVRSAGNRALGPRRIAELEASIQSLAEELLTDLAAAGDAVVDLMEFCSLFPLLVIATLMDAPRSDVDRFRMWGEAHVQFVTHPVPPEVVRHVHATYVDYQQYVLDLVEQHRRHPNPTTLIAAFLDASAGDQITLEELTAMYMLLLFAGHETTTNLIGNGMHALFRNPEQWERLKADPSLVPTAVEEFLRFDSPVHFAQKLVTVDTELGGEPVAAGQTLLVCNGAANHDPAAFDEPATLDVGRKPNDHLAFGYGAHFCLGAPIARMEGRIAFETLIRRFPDIELAADPDELVYRPYYSHRGLTRLPVRLGRDRG